MFPPATGVLSDAKEICAAVKRVSPDTLTALDGVCSVGSEEIRMDDWGVDIVRPISHCKVIKPKNRPDISVYVGHRRLAKRSRCPTWSLRSLRITKSHRGIQEPKGSPYILFRFLE